MVETNCYISIAILLTILFCQCELGFSKKNYHHTNSPTLSPPPLFVDKEKIFGLNSKHCIPVWIQYSITNVANLTAPQTNDVNMTQLFPHREEVHAVMDIVHIQNQLYMISYLTPFCLAATEI
jgi:hypothetical protein